MIFVENGAGLPVLVPVYTLRIVVRTTYTREFTPRTPCSGGINIQIRVVVDVLNFLSPTLWVLTAERLGDRYDGYSVKMVVYWPYC